MPNRQDLIAHLSLVPSVIPLSDEQPEAAVHPVRAEKFVAPGTSAGLLSRDNLLQGLDLPGDIRLILVRAAAGFGKTTVLRQLRERCLANGQRVLWLNLDRADNDPRRLAAHLHAGLQALNGKPAIDVPASPQALLQQLGNLEPGFTVVLDDFEVLDTPQALAFIQQVLAALAHGARLAIASRVNPELGLGRLRMQGQVLDIDTDALRLSPAQTQAYLRGRCQLPITDEQIARLQEITEGWISGLFLATLSFNGRTDLADVVGSFSGNNQELAEYLTEDILSRQSDEIRLFLLQTSILDRFSAPLCDALTQRQDSAALIEQLLRANLFIQPTDAQHRWFRYHRLFHGFLRNALARQLPGHAEGLHQAAAHWYLTHKHPAAAIEHLMRADDTRQAAELLEQHLDELVDAGRLRLMLRWLEQMPSAEREARSRLALTHAWLLVLDRRYRDAMQVVERNPASLETDTIRCLLLAFTDQTEAAITAAQAQIARLSPSDGLQYGMVATPLAFGLITTGRYDDARALLIEMARQAPEERSALLDGIAIYIESSLELTLGHRRAALARLEAASSVQAAVLEGRWVGGKATLDILHALVLYEGDALNQAWTMLNQIPQHALDLGGPDALIAHRVVLARIALQNGNREAWLRHLADLEQLGRRSGSLRILCAAWLERARVATVEGRLDVAAQALSSAELTGKWDRPDVLTFACDTDTPFIARQRLGIARGDYELAATELRTHLDIAESRQQRRRALKLRLLLAMALAGKGRQKIALDALTPALRLASQEGFRRTFLEEGPALVKLLERWAVTYQTSCSSLGIAPDFLADLLQRSGAQKEPSEGSETVETDLQLTTRELQVIRLLAAGNRNRAIAEQMHLSEHTIKTHLRNISAKLGAQGRTEAIAIARARGLLD
ncbi:MAG: LuxR C-terminal-related transcriptional regulator [Pseudomonas sp.]